MLIINSLVTIHLAFVFYMCCSSVTQSRPSLCNPMDCSTPGLPVPHHLPKFTQVHVHCISDAIQSSHPLTLFSSAVNLPQHQRLFQWVGCSHQMTKILELQHQSFQWIFRVDLLVWSPYCSRDSQESSPEPQFEGISSLVLCLVNGPALTTVRDSDV